MKNLLILSMTIIMLSACSIQKSKNVSIEENEKIVREYYEHFNRHQWSEMASMYSEVSDFKDPSLGQGIIKQTRQQIVEKYSELSTMFPDVHDEIVQIYPSGDKHIVVEFVASGTMPDKSKFELPICTIFTIENGLITKDFTYYDNFEEHDQHTEKKQ